MGKGKPRYRRQCLLQLLLLNFFLVGSLQAAITANVPSAHPIYDILDRLDAYGCLNSGFRAFRPQSYGDLRQSIFVSSDTKCNAPKWLIESTRFFSQGTVPTHGSVRAFAIEDDQIALNSIEVPRLTPVEALREGRILFNGPNLHAEALLSGNSGGDFGFAFSVSPGWVLGVQDYEDVNGRFYLHEGYLKVGYRRWEFLYGRSAQRFGSARHGNLLLSGATKPIDLLKLSMRPHRIEPISFLGLVTFESWIGLNSESTHVNDSDYWAIQLGLKPNRLFELGFLQLYQFGGTGTERLSLSDVLKMPFYSGGTLQSRQRMFGVFLGLWEPKKRFQFYTQLAFQELGPVSGWFADDISSLIGFWFPRIGGEGQLRLEYVRTVPNAYQHPIWTQGLVYDQTPLGHPLGPDAEGLYVDIGLPALSGWRPNLLFAYEARDKNPSAGATEWRYRGGAGVTKRWHRTELTAQIQVERANNHAYVRNFVRDILSGVVGLSYAFY